MSLPGDAVEGSRTLLALRLHALVPVLGELVPLQVNHLDRPVKYFKVEKLTHLLNEYVSQKIRTITVLQTIFQNSRDIKKSLFNYLI